MKSRKSGILLHITSLPGKYGIGTLGKEAYEFVDFLAETNQTYWQILPLGHTGYGNSPYSSFSAFAGNPLLIDTDTLPVKTGQTNEVQAGIINYDAIREPKIEQLKKIAGEFLRSDMDKADFERFKSENDYWLSDYALFISLKNAHHEKPFWEFPEEIKNKEANSLDTYRQEASEETEIYKIIQYFFFSQWFQLKKYANEKGIKIIGDIPLYVSPDSADVWFHPENFMLNDTYTPLKVAGVPPDYFSPTGQLWGNPVYDWKRQKENGYQWWKERIKFNLALFDILRFDHFRGLAEFWAVPFGMETAENGEWLPGPDEDFFEMIFQDKSKFIAEDLGVLSERVEMLLEKYNLPGMKILQFAFDSGSKNPFLPHNYDKNCVVYTGTHDNDTSMGILSDYKEEEKAFSKKYFSYTEKNFARDLMKLAWASTAHTAIAPLQDLLQLNSDFRMNTPGRLDGNWLWQYKAEDITNEAKDFLKEITETYSRNRLG